MRSDLVYERNPLRGICQGASYRWRVSSHASVCHRSTRARITIINAIYAKVVCFIALLTGWIYGTVCLAREMLPNKCVRGGGATQVRITGINDSTMIVHLISFSLCVAGGRGVCSHSLMCGTCTA
jgi:hypothetical protein